MTYSDTRDCTACGLIAGQTIEKLWPTAFGAKMFAEWKCRNKACLVRMFENYETPESDPAKDVFNAVCPRCSDKAPTLHQVRNGEYLAEFLCVRCINEISAGESQGKTPDGKIRTIPDPEKPPTEPLELVEPIEPLDMVCELCYQKQPKLIFKEKMWVCRDCLQSLDLGSTG